ncbi:SAM-dependent methyltransferase [Putridiphycobacter roseus]|uniref:SAM-dependent methyltransferase n=1 Tax=Putridiphycobacter roseus TaxID=2219161 RepID=A0A2W1N2W3_9FLAO|nr:SAM-dependent methyltransferase [Putridiphycobacter roseus]PZE18214.1 SAM-dependent methyltransferase [Putridiphycobacter roseus]
MKGRLFVIPIPISVGPPENTLAQSTMDVAKDLRHFVVEKTKTARQFLRKIDRTFPIDDAFFYELNKHNNYEFTQTVLTHLENGINVGVMSEAGYPGIADPGNGVVQMAHKNGIKVIPLIGPSSLFLALATSGLNGQGFTFHGYLPKNESERTNSIKQLSQVIFRTGFAQIFIETPYRNQVMFDALLKHAAPELQLTVALDITGDKEYIVTKTVQDWKSKNLSFDKAPCVFILGKF